GLTKLSRGVDITKLDFLPIDQNEQDGFERRIIDVTCSKQAKWTSPYDPNIVYDLPDQAETVNSIPGGVLDTSYKFLSNLKEFKKSRALSAGVAALFEEGMFSASGSYKRFQSSLTNSSRRISEVESFFSAIQVDFLPFWELSLSSSALKYINNILPKDYTDNPSKYDDFFKYFGTHYFSTGKFGGLFRMSISIETSLFQTMNGRQIELNAKAAYMEILKAKGGFSGNTTRMSADFSSKTDISARFYGGSANLLDEQGWKSWWSSLPKNPWLFAGKLEPIIKIFPDGPKKESMRIAYKVYLDKAYLKEIERLLYSFLNKGNGAKDRALRFLDRTKNLLSQAIPDREEVKYLGSEVERFVIPPDWFLYNTQLCFHWEHWKFPIWFKQCDAPSQTICAIPNSQTPYYKDFTNSHGGGCVMKWAIMSPKSDPWFQQVRICFRWKADGNSGQCGGGAPRETCSYVGSYTREYLDDTDNRPGGCLMSWKFMVPKNALGWILNTKLCLYWNAEGNSDQCGDGVHKTLCALANEWTPYYKDNTDDREGGCQMSWGFRTV
ncbi:perivitellin-2 67 kDa subunit-like protein, partial [Dinothrombium tinctorium]